MSSKTLTEDMIVADRIKARRAQQEKALMLLIMSEPNLRVAAQRILDEFVEPELKMALAGYAYAQELGRSLVEQFETQIMEGSGPLEADQCLGTQRDGAEKSWVKP